MVLDDLFEFLHDTYLSIVNFKNLSRYSVKMIQDQDHRYACGDSRLNNFSCWL